MSDSLVVVIEEMAKNVETIKQIVIGSGACIISIAIAIYIKFGSKLND